MKQSISIVGLAATLLLVAAAAYAAQDYNSSRSNRGVAADAPEETERMLREVTAEALTVSRRMYDVDGRDGYTGEYEITVDVSVRFERVASPVQ